MFAFIHPENFLYNNTYVLALKNLANRYNRTYLNLPYVYLDIKEFDILPIFKDQTILFLEDNPEYHDIKFTKKMKQVFPNSYIVMFCSDTIYNGYCNCSLVDLRLETIKMFTYNSMIPSHQDHIYWTISETLIKQIEETKPLRTNLNKENDVVCLCKRTENERRHEFFDFLKVKHDLELFSLPAIYELYCKTWVILGHTIAVWKNEPRTMKGFRDWLAPFCDSVLIYDNYEDIEDINKKANDEIVPIYPYCNVMAAYELIQELKTNPAKYNTLIEKQKKWVLENTLEKQIENKLKKYGLL